MIYKDRIEAGNLLAKRLEKYKGSDALILAIPRGGVPIAFVVAKALHLPLGIVLSKKIGHPFHKEYAIGAVTLKSRILSDAAAGVPLEYIEVETKRIREKLQKRYDQYYGEKPPLPIKDEILIIVDDGIATGNTILSTIKMLSDEKPKKIVVAIPVASSGALDKLRSSLLIDEVVCLQAPFNFQAVGQFYKNFDQVEDSEVNYLLRDAVAE